MIGVVAEQIDLTELLKEGDELDPHIPSDEGPALTELGRHQESRLQTLRVMVADQVPSSLTVAATPFTDTVACRSSTVPLTAIVFSPANALRPVASQIPPMRLQTPNRLMVPTSSLCACQSRPIH